MRKLADVQGCTGPDAMGSGNLYACQREPDFRAQQVATLSEMAHELATSEKLGSLLESLEDAAGSE